MKRIALVVVAVALVVSGAAAQDLERLFKTAVNTETVDRNCKGAIEQYKKVAAGSNRALAAQALLRMAGCYTALGDAEAQRVYHRIVREFADQKEAVAIANSRIEPVRTPARGLVVKDVDGLNASGSVSANAHQAAYINWNNGNIVMRDLQTGTTRILSSRRDVEEVQSVVVSRDAKFVAFQSTNGCVERTPVASSNGVLCVLSSEGEPNVLARTVIDRPDIRRITPLDWSPDGSSIAAVVHREDGAAQVAVVTVMDGRLAVLQSTDWRGATRMFFSPDGRYVAFDIPVDDASDHREIRVVAVSGNEGGTVVQGTSRNIIMGWTPDGGDVLFASDRAGALALWAQRVTKIKPEGMPRLVHAGLSGSLSLGVTSGGSLYFSVPICCRDVEIHSVDLASGKQRSGSVRPALTYVGRNMMPAWSRDGRLLAHVRQRGLSSNERPNIVGIRDSSTGAVRELHPKLTYINGLDWAPDASTLITYATDLKGRVGVFTIDVRSGQVDFVVDGAYPQYAPDGRRIFYVKPAEGLGPTNLIERDLASGAERTVAAGEFVRFSVSPDGRSLAATAGGLDTGNARDVVVISVDTGTVHQVLRAQTDDRIPTYARLPWTPDGQALLMRNRPSPTGGELWLVPTTGAAPRLLDVDVKGWAIGAAGVLSLHPDGVQLAGTRLRREATGSEVKVLENVATAATK